MSKRALIVIIVLVIVAVVIVVSIIRAYLFYINLRGSGSHTSSASISPTVSSICSGSGNMTIGRVIKWLFDHHSDFRFRLYEFPSNFTIIWVITAPSHSMLNVLVTHIREMECVIEHGGNPRPWDPVFRVDSYITRRYVKTEIVWLNSTAIKVIKIARNRCAYEVIKLHARIVEGFFKTGREEAQKVHQIPDYVLKVCQPYLNETAP
ncbi:MAG: hypothetical protein GXO23_06550 [Crenarchaeota archaeon]|nr:hypothetical protein [Thermoproteota archaeon]